MCHGSIWSVIISNPTANIELAVATEPHINNVLRLSRSAKIPLANDIETEVTTTAAPSIASCRLDLVMSKMT